MRYKGLVLTFLFAGGLLVVLSARGRAAIPSWVDNNPANAPRMPQCAAGFCGTMSGCSAAASAQRTRRCCLVDWFRSCRLACLARRYERCAALYRGQSPCGDGGYGCGTGCNVHGCGAADGCGASSDCDGHHLGDMHSEGYEADENVIYDGPAPGSVIHEGPTSGALEPDHTHGKSDVPYRLVNNAQKVGAGSEAFKKGLASFRSHALAEALGSFEMAVSDEPDNAMYHYYLALTFYELYGSDAGIDVLQQAVQLERREPIANWGKHMERVQGRSRLWIEKARHDAGLVR